MLAIGCEKHHCKLTNKAVKINNHLLAIIIANVDGLPDAHVAEKVKRGIVLTKSIQRDLAKQAHVHKALFYDIQHNSRQLLSGRSTTPFPAIAHP